MDRQSVKAEKLDEQFAILGVHRDYLAEISRMGYSAAAESQSILNGQDISQGPEIVSKTETRQRVTVWKIRLSELSCRFADVLSLTKH